MESQVALELEVVLGLTDERRRSVDGLRELFCIKPVRAHELLAELGEVHVQTLHVDNHFQLGVLNVLRIEIQRRIKIRETTDEGREAQVIDLEDQRRVGLVQHVGATAQLADFSVEVRSQQPVTGHQCDGTYQTKSSPAQI